ncbi:MAG: septum formation protein [Paraglaciecola sp.]|jgi:septum formation protein
MLILASQSPRRAELLRQIDVPFKQVNIQVDESHQKNESAEQYVLRLAKEKSRAGWLSAEKKYPTLGADTIVVTDTDKILGKPANKEESAQMLRLLSAKQHKVLTAIAVTFGDAHEPKQESLIVTTIVCFAELSSTQIEWYWQTGEPQDKAGSYAIQGLGGQFVKNIKGSYSAVVGLPLYETQQLLNRVG